jgi:hypothetical protein
VTYFSHPPLAARGADDDRCIVFIVTRAALRVSPRLGVMATGMITSRRVHVTRALPRWAVALAIGVLGVWSVPPDNDAGQSCAPHEHPSLPTQLVYCTVLWDTSGGAGLVEVPAAVRKGMPPTCPAHRLSPAAG